MQLKLSKKSIIKMFILLFAVIPFHKAQAQINVLWESRFTSAGQNTDTGKEIEIDNNGNVYVVGTSYTNGTNGYDIVTLKYDALGNQLWASTFNGTGNALDEGRDIAVDKNGNVYVTGYTASAGPNYNYITIKYDASGVQQWANTYNGSGNGFDEAYAIVVDTNSNVYVTGGSDAGSQGSNFVTIKYNTSGVQQWATPYNGPGNSIDAATQIGLDAQFNVYVTGHSYGSGTDLDIATIKYNNSGSQQWVSRYNGALSFFDVPEALFIDNLNNVYVAGASYGGLATENDYATIKINSAGVQQWAKTFDGPLNDEDKAFDLVVDQNQNVYVTGRSMGANGTAENMLTLKYDASGTIIWQNTYDGPSSGYDEAQQMRLGASGALYVTGYSAGNGTNNDYLTLKYDTSNGSISWKARFDGPASNSDQAFAMEIDALENIYVTGTSKDPTSNQDFSTIKWCQLTNDAGNDVAICLGDTIQLNASAIGATSYNWTPTTGLSDNNASNPMAYPTTTTTYFVSAMNAFGCVDYDTITVTVNPLPSATILTSGPTTFCLGDSVMLTVNDSGTYNWTPTGDTTQTITVFNPGNYTVNIIDSNSCSNVGSQSITVNSLPNVNAGSDANVCNGDSIQINATGAIIYTWNSQNTLTDSTIANPLVYPTSPTNYWVIGEDANGCKNTDTVYIAISIAPTANMTNTSVNDTLDLNLPNGGDIQFFSTLSTNVISYDWDFGDGGTDNVANPIYTYTGPGVFTVMFVAINGGCTDTVYNDITVLQAISIKENNIADNVTIYPNPANEYITIHFKNIIDQNTLLTIYNALGESVMKLSSAINANSSIKINTNNFDNGIYFIEMEIDNLKTIKRFSVIK
jgi:PKD repeat protein